MIITHAARNFALLLLAVQVCLGGLVAPAVLAAETRLTDPKDRRP